VAAVGADLSAIAIGCPGALRMAYRE